MARPLVSVVIPAHNPGPYIEPCIRSILRQTLPTRRFEVIFVDDGSTDGTSERLDRLAREAGHVRVLHIPASGAPGRPRNVGMEAAIGEYIQFLDADDELAPNSLQRLVRMARRHGSDIVLGKFASETLSRRQDLFTRNRPVCTLDDTPQLVDASMGPTKLFRTAFLREHQLTFREGWRQMEDQLFTLGAYLRARVISVLGDEPCYYFRRREDEGHISAELVDPDSHAGHLAEILDEIVAQVPDGSLRERLLARFHRFEALRRLAGPAFLEADDDYRRRLFVALREVTRPRIPEAVIARLGAMQRVRTRLLFADRFEELYDLALRADDLVVAANVEAGQWVGGRIALSFRVELERRSDGTGLTLEERNGDVLLDSRVTDGILEPVSVAGELASMRAQVSLVDQRTALEWIVPASIALSPRRADSGDASAPRVASILGLVELDPQRVGPGERPLEDGTWTVVVRWSGLGFTATGPLRYTPSTTEPPSAVLEHLGPALIGRPPRWVVPRTDEGGGLRLAVAGIDRLPAGIDAAAIRVVNDGASLRLAMPVVTDQIGLLARAVIRLAGETGSYDLPAKLLGAASGVVIATQRGAPIGSLPRGRYALRAHLGSVDGPSVGLGWATVPAAGGLRIADLRRLTRRERLHSTVLWVRRALLRLARTTAMSTVRRLPQPAKNGIRTMYGRIRG